MSKSYVGVWCPGCRWESYRAIPVARALQKPCPKCGAGVRLLAVAAMLGVRR